MRPKSAEPTPSAALAALGATAVVCLGLFLAPAALAFEQLPGSLGCFAGTGIEQCGEVAEGKFGEEVQLGGVGGIAVNDTGAGGMPKGTLYVASKNGAERWVSMFEPEGEGLRFVERWEMTAFEGPYERCGPLLGEEEVGAKKVAKFPCQPQPTGGVGWVDVEVDEESGNVYVFNGFRRPEGGLDEVIEYQPDGSGVITRFAQQAAEGKTMAETPEEVHQTAPPMGPLAVDSSGAGDVAKGTVYVADETQGASPYRRLMVFEPESEGDFAHYAYAGEVVAAPTSQKLWGPVADEAGNLYLVGDETSIEEFTPEAPATFPASPASPICEYEFAPAGITALTVDPTTGDPFFFSYKKPKRLRRLGTCDEGTHEFAEASNPEAVALEPERDDLWGLVYDPARQLTGRPAGVLYGAAPNPVPSSAVGKGQPGQSALGYIFAAPRESPPTIDAEAVSRVTSSSARLSATLDPKGFETHYAFEYESEADYEANPPTERFAGAREAPLGGAQEEGTGPRAIAGTLAGLAPDTTYRYRAVASSECVEHSSKACGSEGEANALHTYPSGTDGLPDGRAWELVSPAQKDGGQVLPADPEMSSCPGLACKPGTTYQYFPLQSSGDGEAIAYEGSPFDQEGAAIENEYLARRGAGGWQSANLTPPLLVSKGGQGYKSFSPSLATSVLEQKSPPLSPEALPQGYPDLYTQPSADPLELTPLIREEPPARSAEQFELLYAGASAEGSRIFFAANDALSEEVPGISPGPPPVSANQFNLYEWHAGTLTLVNVLPGDAIATPGSFAAGSAQTISVDGSRAFWISAAGQLYVRVNGSETLQVSESQRSTPDPLGTQPATFLGASADGTRALFSSSEELTDDSNTGLAQEVVVKASGGTFTLTFASQTTAPLAFNANTTQVQDALEALPSIGKGNVAVTSGREGNVVTFTNALASNPMPMSASGAALTGTVALRAFRPGRDLYEWDEGTILDLTAGQGSWGLQGVVGTGKDLARLYFVDTAVLSSAAGEENCRPIFLAGGEVCEEAEAGKLNLYAYSEGGAARFVARLVPGDNAGSSGGDWEVAPSSRTAEASPNGRFLAFRSLAPLTGYENTTRGGKVVGEVFLYDANSRELICASCNRSGAPPLGPATLRLIRGMRSWLDQPRYLTDAGRLYFDSQDSLALSDTNEGAEDVYEYELGGVGSCEEPEGCVRLISAGREGEDSNFLAMNEGTAVVPAGADVFFTTRDRLVGADSDSLIDLYDAREGGAFAAESELPPSPCQGEACQASAGQPPESTPATPGFTGPGNYTPPRPCHKRRVRHQGKCVKKKSAGGHGNAKRKRGGVK